MKDGVIFFLIILLVLMTVLADDGRDPRLLIQASVEKADYEKCVLVHPGPIQPNRDQSPFARKKDIS